MCMSGIACTIPDIHVNLDFQRQINKATNLRALFSIFIGKKAAQARFEPTTSRSTN